MKLQFLQESIIQVLLLSMQLKIIVYSKKYQSILKTIIK